MPGALARRIGAVVTAGTIVDDVGVVKRRGSPCNRRMAVVAVITTVDMCRMFAGRGYAIVAGATGAQHLRVVDGEDRKPHVRCMTVFADIAGLYVRLSFARGIGTVVAADTISSDVDMVKVRWQPARRRMAVLAVVTTVDMTLVLAGRDDAVVTGSAGTNHLGVFDRIDRYPHIRCVAVFADVAGLYVRLGLARGFGTVVAAEAVAGDVGVIEVRG